MSQPRELVRVAVIDDLVAEISRPPIRAAGIKPLLRGIPDVVATVLAVPAAAIMVATVDGPAARLAAAIYGASLALLFAVSATYHTPWWPKNVRELWRRIDHSTIYVLIAGTYTPICLVALDPSIGHPVLAVQWVIAALGVAKSFLWRGSPRWLNTSVYVAMGWMVAPLFPQLWASLGPISVALLLGGGVAFTVGAVVYVRRWPNPWPAVFGYHEIFHVLVIAACAAHYAAMWALLS